MTGPTARGLYVIAQSVQFLGGKPAADEDSAAVTAHDGGDDDIDF
jgi:hypothetical protein